MIQSSMEKLKKESFYAYIPHIERLKSIAKERGVTYGKLLRQIIEEWLK